MVVLAEKTNVFFLSLKELIKDARYYQITYLLFFLLYGIFALGWDTDLFSFITTVTACILTQAVGTYFTSKDYSTIKSALISAFSLCLMLKFNSLTTVVIASVLSIGSKFILRYNNKHIFNPTNFGIITTILLTGDAWISPGQWGSDGILVFLIGACGLIVLVKVKKLDTAITFFCTFLGLNFIRNVLYLNWPLDFFTHQLTSGTLLLFTFFMITDPVSTPSSSKARIIWAFLVGVLAFFLSNKLYIHGAPVWALFFLSPLTPLFDKLFKQEKFKWIT